MMRKWLVAIVVVLLVIPLVPVKAESTTWINKFCTAPSGQTKVYKQAVGSKVWSQYDYVNNNGTVTAPYSRAYGDGVIVRAQLNKGMLTGTMQQVIKSPEDPHVPNWAQLVFVNPKTGEEVGRSEAKEQLYYEGAGDPYSANPAAGPLIPGREIRFIQPAINVIEEMNKLGLDGQYLLYVQPLDYRMKPVEQCLNFSQTPLPVSNKLAIANKFNEMYAGEKRTISVIPYDDYVATLSNRVVANATKSNALIEVVGKEIGMTTLTVRRDSERDEMTFKVNPYISTKQTTINVDTPFQVTIAGLPSVVGGNYQVYGTTRSGLPTSVKTSNRTATSFTMQASEEEILDFYILYERNVGNQKEQYMSNVLTVNISGGRPATSVIVRKQQHTIYVGEKKSLRASMTVEPANAIFAWKSADSDYVTVDNKGYITGIRDSIDRAIDVTAISGNYKIVFKVIVKTVQAKTPTKPVIGVQVANNSIQVDAYRTNDDDPVLQTAKARDNELDADYTTKAEIRISGVNLKDSHYKIIKTNNMNDGTWLPLDIGSGKVVQSTKPADMTESVGLNTVYYNVLHMPSISNVELWENRAETFKFLSTEEPIRKYGYKADREGDPDKFYGNHLFYAETKYTSSVWPKAVELKEASKYWGYFVAPNTGYYNLGISSDDGSFGYVLKDGQPIVFTDQFKVQSSLFSSANKPIYMTKGFAYPIYLEYFNWGGQADFRLFYRFSGTSKLAVLYGNTSAAEGKAYSQPLSSIENGTAMKLVDTELRTTTNTDPLVFAEARFDVPFEVELPREEGSYYIAVKATSSAPTERQLLYGPFNIVNKTLPKISVNYTNGSFISPVKSSVTKGEAQQPLSADNGIVALNNNPTIQVNVVGDGKVKPSEMTYRLLDEKNNVVANGTISKDGQLELPLTVTGKLTLQVEATLYKNRVVVTYGPIEVMNLTVSSDKSSIYVGEKVVVQANVISTRVHPISWTPTNMMAGTSNLQAILVGTVPGIVNVTARTNDAANASATQSIIVKKAVPTSLSFSSPTITIKVGETLNLREQLQIVPAEVVPFVKLSWNDSTPNTYITLNSSGLIKGLQVGYTRVTVTAVEDQTNQGKITVIVKEDSGKENPTDPGGNGDNPKSNFKW